MARPKKIKEKPSKATNIFVSTPSATEMVQPTVIPKSVIAPLSIDYPHEYLNDMGRKINEIIMYINAL